MKKAIRITATLAVLSLAISMLAACNFPTFGGDSTTATVVPDTTATTLADTGTQDISSTEITDETKPTDAVKSTKVEIESIDTILNKIATYPQGTAGSTMKCVDISIRLINFTENTVDSGSTLNRNIEKYFGTLNSDEKALFEQNLYEIDYMARKLIKGESSTMQKYIDQSGEKYDKGNYSLNKYEAVYKLLANS